MPQELKKAEIVELINLIPTYQNPVDGAKEVYRQLLAKGYDYAGWGLGVAAGSSITGREAYDFLARSALAGIGSEACRNLTPTQIDKIKVEMADAYLQTLLRIADLNGDKVNRDVRYSETEQFHKDVFERNGLSIDNWTLKIPMDLLRQAGNDAAIERTWEIIRATQGMGFDSLVVSGGLAAVVQVALNSSDPAIREKAQKWIDTVIGASAFEKLKKLTGDLVKAESQERLNELGQNLGRIGFQFDFDYQRAREKAIELIRDMRLKAEDIFRTVISPIVLDLDGDGVETISIDRQVHFDHDGNGFAESTGWVGRDDGLLVYDRNGNGSVDSGAELFGSYTVLQNGSKAANGFLALAEFDLNGDQTINAQDAVFSSLRIWRDLNLDGMTQAGEMFTLQELGVASMSTQYVNSNKVDSQGNERRQVGQYTRADGSTAQMHDVWLERNSGIAFRNGEDTFDSPAMQALPDIDGFGALPDLRDAMASDTTLRGYVEEFVGQPGAIRREQLIDLIVMRWTGADRVTFGIDSPYYDERKLFAIDVASGEAVYDRNHNQRPNAGPQASVYIEQGYAALRNFVGTELERQVTLFLNEQLELRIDPHGDLYFELKDYAQLRATNPQQALAMLTRLVQNSGEQLLNLGWNGYELLRQEIAHFANDPAMAAYMRDTLNIALGAGNVQPANTSAATVVSGSSGNDTLQGGSETVVFAGGGDDSLWLSKASTILFGPGNGHDRIGGVGHTIVLDAALAPSDVSVSTVGDALVLTLPGGETLSIDGWAYGAGRSAATTPVSRIVFANGSAVWTAGDLGAHVRTGNGDDTVNATYLPDYINGQAGNDSLTGGYGSDFIVGGAGNDTIYSGSGHDLLLGGDGDDRLDAHGNGTQSHDFLVGGAGNDYLSGDDGADTYFFERGFGTDTLFDFNQSALGNDVVIFGPGLRLDDMEVLRENGAIAISFRGGSDKLILQGWSGQPEYAIERFLFDDGTMLTSEQILARTGYRSTEGNDTLTALDDGASLSGQDGNDRLTGGQGTDMLKGDAGNDILEGLQGQDTLVGGTGNDRLYGNQGADTHVIRAGDGSDIIHDGMEAGVTDTVQLDFRPDQVSVRRGGHSESSLMLDIDGGAQSVEVLSWFENEDIGGSLQVRFNDGTVWSAEQLWRSAPYSATAVDRYGTPDDELLVGDGQANFIKGQSGADTLDGGAGNDTLHGGLGDDTFLFRRGMGQDMVYDLGGTDTVSFEAGIAASDLTIAREGSSLRITLNGTVDGIRLDEYSDRNRIERLKFADGSTIDLMANAAGPIVLTAGHDLLEGTDQDDRIEGLGGNDSLGGNGGRDVLKGGDGEDILWGDEGADTLEGGANGDQIHMDGEDTIVFGRGDGVDLVLRNLEHGGTLRFGAGVTPGDVVLSGGANGALQVSFAGDPDDALVISSWFHEEKSDRTLGRFEFADGTVWTLANIRAHLPMTGTISADYFYGTHGAETLSGGSGRDQLSAWSGNDLLQGGEGDDALNGGLGNDTLDGGTGSDSLSGGGGNDTYRFDAGFGTDTIVEGVAGEAETANRVVFGAGIAAADVVVTGDNQFTPGSNSNLYLSVLGTSDKLTLSKWFDPNRSNVTAVEFADGTVWDRAALLEKFYALERGGTMYGTEAADRLIGDDGADSLKGLTGNDLLSGMGGDDELLGAEGNDTLAGGTGSDLLLGGIGDDTYLFQRGDGVDRIADFDRATGGSDKLVFGAGIAPADVIVKREDDHIVLTVRGSTNGQPDVVAIRWFGSDALRIESVVFSNGETWTAAQLETMANSHGATSGTENADTLTGTTGADKIFGLGGNDSIAGLAGDDTLDGGEGADTLDGGAGSDLLTGGRGNDRYLVDDAADLVVELPGEGTDTVASTLSHVLPDGVENLELLGTSLAGTGNALANRIVGGSGNDTLDGAAGADTLQGGAGNDSYLVDNAGDVVIEAAAEGVDQVTATVSWQMSEGVENLTLSGDAAVFGTGNAAANNITGTAAANTLDGGAGNDTLIGGDGDDTYVVDAAGDVLVEQPGQGWDRVDASVSWTLGTSFEELRLTGTAGLAATGNSADNVLRGNAGDNTLNGGAGADTLYGGAGNDIYVADNQSDSVIEKAGEGTDRVNASVNYTLPDQVEELAFTGTAALRGFGNEQANYLLGNTGANQLTGNGGNDTLEGGAGNDTLTGGQGDDTYVVDTTGDVVTEAAGAGTDTVRTSITLASLAANVEQLVLSGSGTLNGTGNTLANIIIGNAGSNRLDGGAGADTLKGGTGNDTYVVDNAADLIVEASGEGTDTVEALVTWSLASNLENLTLGGTAALNGTGNSLGNTLTGNSGANRLDGGEGADTMKGGSGNDTYVVDNAGDTVTETASGGTDTIEASLSWTLGSELENLTLTGSAAIDATGNTLANTLRGNSGNNVLSGGSGSDTLIGGAGNDTYVVDVTTDVVTETAGMGTDSVQSAVTWTLGNNLENLTLTGATATNGTGNTLDNVLIGNGANNTLTGLAGNDTLDGGAGNDTLVGGTGNDTYVVNVASDVVTEKASEGTDTVKAAVTWTLGANLENLTLTGTAAINGTGNTLANALVGNAGANVLSGDAGDDRYDGGAGNDTFTDGSTTSNDTYLWGVGAGLDTLTDAGGSLDHVDLAAGIAKSQLKFTKNGNDLVLGITGQTDQLTIKSWYTSANNRIEEFRLADGSKVLASEVNGLISAMAGFIPMGSVPGGQPERIGLEAMVIAPSPWNSAEDWSQR